MKKIDMLYAVVETTLKSGEKHVSVEVRGLGEAGKATAEREEKTLATFPITEMKAAMEYAGRCRAPRLKDDAARRTKTINGDVSGAELAKSVTEATLALRFGDKVVACPPVDLGGRAFDEKIGAAASEAARLAVDEYAAGLAFKAFAEALGTKMPAWEPQTARVANSVASFGIRHALDFGASKIKTWSADGRPIGLLVVNVSGGDLIAFTMATARAREHETEARVVRPGETIGIVGTLSAWGEPDAKAERRDGKVFFPIPLYYTAETTGADGTKALEKRAFLTVVEAEDGDDLKPAYHVRGAKAMGRDYRREFRFRRRGDEGAKTYAYVDDLTGALGGALRGSFEREGSETEDVSELPKTKESAIAETKKLWEKRAVWLDEIWTEVPPRVYAVVETALKSGEKRVSVEARGLGDGSDDGKSPAGREERILATFPITERSAALKYAERAPEPTWKRNEAKVASNFREPFLVAALAERTYDDAETLAKDCHFEKEATDRMKKWARRKRGARFEKIEAGSLAEAEEKWNGLGRDTESLIEATANGDVLFLLDEASMVVARR